MSSEVPGLVAAFTNEQARLEDQVDLVVRWLDPIDAPLALVASETPGVNRAPLARLLAKHGVPSEAWMRGASPAPESKVLVLWPDICMLSAIEATEPLAIALITCDQPDVRMWILARRAIDLVTGAAVDLPDQPAPVESALIRLARTPNSAENFRSGGRDGFAASVFRNLRATGHTIDPLSAAATLAAHGWDLETAEALRESFEALAR
jgi:hypothetical protein